MDDFTSLEVLTNIDLLRNVRAPIEARRQAIDLLARQESPVVLPVLIRALDDPDYYIRKSAIAGCERFASPLAVDGLLKVLRERTFSEREEAIRALGKIRDRRAMEPIAESLLYSDWMSIRSAAAESLGRMGYKEAVPALIEGLSDFEAPVRANVAEALGKIGSPQAIEPLVKSMLAEKGWNKRHLAKALAKIGGASLKPLIMVLADPKQPQDNREVVAETLGEIIAGLERPQDHQAQIKLAVDLLVAELNDRYNGIRSHIARAALTQISEVVSDQLIEAFANSDPLLRDQVAYILGDSKSQHLNPKLIRALSFANDLVASGAARVLYFRGVNPREHGYTGPL